MKNLKDAFKAVNESPYTIEDMLSEAFKFASLSEEQTPERKALMDKVLESITEAHNSFEDYQKTF